MSCLEHVCRDCGHEWFDNNRSFLCPVCGSTNTLRCFDEDDDGYRDDYDEPEEDEW